MGLMAIWTEPELTCGFVAASAPAFPRLVTHIRSSSNFEKVTAIFGYKKPNAGAVAQVQIEAGEWEDGKKQPREIITDVDFHDLVLRTDGTTTTMDSIESEEPKKHTCQGDEIAQVK